METQVTDHHQHTTNDIGKTVLSLGAILAVVFSLWQIQNSSRAEIRPELQEIRQEIRGLNEKVVHVMGQQDVILRKLSLGK